jgi:hypothetical protein
MHHRFAAALFSAAALLCACPEDPPPPPGEEGCFTGDKEAAPEMIIVHKTFSGTIAVTLAEGPVPMIEPPQGGRVMFIAARARNMNGCPIKLTTAFRDQCNGRVMGLEARDIILKPNAEGWLEPEFPEELANYSNLAACPKANADRNINNEPYRLEVRLEDRYGRVAEATLENIRPYCAEAAIETECKCLCRAKYVLGECPGEGPDAGVAPGTCLE